MRLQAPAVASSAACGGHCAAYAAEGEPCNGPCAPGLQCRYSPTTPYGTCTRTSGPGGPCPCGAGSYCDYGAFGVGGEPTTAPTCKAVHRGGFCASAYECAPGFTCAGAPTACVPLVGLGAPCGASAVCGSGYYCDALSARCAPFPEAAYRTSRTARTRSSSAAAVNGFGRSSTPLASTPRSAIASCG